MNMKKLSTTILLFFIFGLLFINAQSKSDSLFLQQLPNSNPQLVEGKKYIFELEKQYSSPEYGKSLLYDQNDTPTLSAYSQSGDGVPFASFKDKTITFKGIKNGKVKVADENKPCFILTFTCDNKTYCAYEFTESLSRAKYDLIEADFVDKINKLLVGKTLYTKSANWLSYNESKSNSNDKTVSVREGTCKYCPVVVSKIINDYDDKYLVLFKPKGLEEEYCFGNIVFEPTKSNFSRYFTLSDPKDNYPNISQDHWEQIMSQKVKKGLTIDEVKVAYGKPDEVYTENDDEIWVYYNLNKKDYAISFKNGIVDDVKSLTSTYY